MSPSSNFSIQVRNYTAGPLAPNRSGKIVYGTTEVPRAGSTRVMWLPQPQILWDTFLMHGEEFYKSKHEEAALEAKAASELLPQHFFWSNHLISARNCSQRNYSEPSLPTSFLLLVVATCSNAQDVGWMQADYAVNYFVRRKKCNHSRQFYLDAFLPLSIWAAIPGTQVKVGKLLVGRWTTPLHMKQPQLQF